jgi:hypothetical protein
MARIPAGLSSAVNADNKKFILQTEFRTDSEAPPDLIKGRIKTTVAVEGQVVHKVEKFFEGDANDPESFIGAEKAIKTQHISVARIVSTKPKEFLATVSELTISAEDRLALIPGIEVVLKVDLSDLSGMMDDADVTNPLLKNMELIRNLVMSVSLHTRIGKLKRMVGTIDDIQFMLVGYEGGTFFLNLKENADVSTIFKELEKAKS